MLRTLHAVTNWQLQRFTHAEAYGLTLPLLVEPTMQDTIPDGNATRTRTYGDLSF